MHDSVRDFVKDIVQEHHYDNVLEIGSKNINGSIRDLISSFDYIGIDLAPGKDVDVVMDASEFRMPFPVDLVICCEVLEHSDNVEGIVQSISENLRNEGEFIITCATDPRESHSGIDGGKLREDEYYKNVDEDYLLEILENNNLIYSISEVSNGDLRVWGRKIEQ